MYVNITLAIKTLLTAVDNKSFFHKLLMRKPMLPTESVDKLKRGNFNFLRNNVDRFFKFRIFFYEFLD